MKVYIVLDFIEEHDTDVDYDVKGVFLNEELAIQKAKELYNDELKNVKSFHEEFKICADYFNCGFNSIDKIYHVSVLEREVNENISNE